jgi:hypothetical protein
MSLINDALKRAKDAQQKSARVAPAPQLRPMEPATQPPRSPGIVVFLAVFLLGAIVVYLLWARHNAPANPQPVAAKPAPAQVSIPEAKPVVQAAAMPAAPAPKTEPAPPPTHDPAAVVPPPQPVKLQAIFFAPGHSSAIINGKTVHTGDVFKGFRIAAINRTSATLISATETNVMTLEEQ